MGWVLSCNSASRFVDNLGPVMDELKDNPDRAYLEHMIRTGRFGVPFELTAGLRDFKTRLLGGTVGSVKLGYEVPDSSIQGNGVVSGGTVMTMLDYALAFAVLSKLNFGQTCATASITVNMLAAVKPTSLEARAVVERAGRQIAFARADLYDPSRDIVVANASAAFAVLDVSRFQSR